jgi:hypothetical protein
MAVNGSGSANGASKTFKTSGTKPTRGRLLVPAVFLRVHGGRVSAPFRCDSKFACSGLFTINVHARLVHARGIATIDCTRSGEARYDIAAGKTRTTSVGVTAACMSLLRTASRHEVWAKLTSRPRTGQTGVLKIVRLSTSATSGRALDAIVAAWLRRL